METKTQSRMPVQAFLETAASRPGEIAMVQPVGGGKLREYTWEEAAREARQMAS